MGKPGYINWVLVSSNFRVRKGETHSDHVARGFAAEPPEK